FPGRNSIVSRASSVRFAGFVTALCIVSHPFAAVLLPRQSTPPAPMTLRSLAKSRHVTIGAAVPSCLLSELEYTAILPSEFSQLEPENEMKFAPIHPRPDSDPQPYNFSGADVLVTFAHDHLMLVRGHTLVWHTQVPDWVAKGDLAAPQLAYVLH